MRIVGSSSTIKHGLAASASRRAVQRRCPSSLDLAAMMAREVEAHRRALADLGIDPHLPARLPGEAVDHRQPEPGALADRLGGEERIEGARDHVGRHAGAGVGDAERDVLPRRQVALARGALVEPFVGGLDGEAAAVGHGVARVDAEVEQRVLELRADRPAPATGRGAPTTSTAICGPTVRRISSSMPATSRLTSVGLGSSVWRREKASRRWVSAAARLRSALRGRM